MLVAAVAGAVVGFVSFRIDRIRRIEEIGLNAVDPAPAGRGVATTRYTAALTRMMELGMPIATLTTGGDASHPPARRAYAKARFGPGIPSVSRYRRFARAPPAPGRCPAGAGTVSVVGR